jgi:hypothetical protein
VGGLDGTQSFGTDTSERPYLQILRTHNQDKNHLLFVNPFLLYYINRKIGTRPSNSNHSTMGPKEQKKTECALTIAFVPYKTTNDISIEF